ncbi:MAG: hypothetical protein NVS4B3_17870 [Gemmatimonadaceae bacterium]
MYSPLMNPLDGLRHRGLPRYAAGVTTAALAELLLILIASHGRMGSGHPSGWVVLALIWGPGGVGAIGGLTERRRAASGRARRFWQGVAAMVMPLAAIPILDMVGLATSTPAIALVSLAIGAVSSVVVAWIGRRSPHYD